MLTLGVLFSSCENDLETVRMFGSHSELPTEVCENVELIYSDSSIMKMTLKAPLLNRYSHNPDSPVTKFPEGVKVSFFNDLGETNSWITAKWAINFEALEKMEARDSVVVVNTNGERLDTEHLIWEKEKKTIHTQAFVTITTPEEVIYGTGLEANEDFTKYKIQNIKGTFTIEDNEDE